MISHMNKSLQTLLYGLDASGINSGDTKLLFLNGEYCAEVNKDWLFQQYFKPYVDELDHHGFSVIDEIEEQE